ncbi:MAG: ABC transporter substrate-binding protein, partial [Planctomycetes bacterium]|nr:ABC transporter substrate-binding protein [Planctomycetota bacterium]
MKMSRPAALALAALGLVLMVAGPLIPGGERLIRKAPPDSGHVTDLAKADDGSILVGTEEGTLWRLADGRWARVGVDLGEQPVTALSANLAGDAAKGPIGTAGGLVNPPAGMPALTVRVTDEIRAGDRLVVSSDDGLYVQGAGVWQRALEGVYVYRLDLEHGGGDHWVHAGTIDQGVFTTRASRLLEWTPNRDGLPQRVNVFSFVLTAGDRLIAGTDQGLFWQPAPFEPWRRLAVGLEQSRMLSLLLEPRPGAEAQRLWIGSDDGL